MSVYANGAQVTGADGLLVPAGGNATVPLLSGALDGVVVEVASLATAPVTAAIELSVHPLTPQGTYYATTVGLAVATGAVAPGEAATLLDLQGAPGTNYGLTLENTDGVAHAVNVNLLTPSPLP